MGALEIVLGVLLILLTGVLVFFILLQEGRGGMGALTGKTLNTTLKSWTKFGCIAVMVLVVLLNVIAVYF